MSEQTQKQEYIFWDTTLTEKSAILYFQQVHLLQKYEYKLLGDFDKKTGKYKISDDMLNELVAVKKNVDKTDGDKRFLSAKCGKFLLKFVLQTGQIDAKTKYASLKFFEEFAPITGGEKTQIVTPVAYYKDVDDMYFEAKISKLFNICPKDDSDGKNMDNKDVAKKIFSNMSLCEKLFSSILVSCKNKDKLYVKSMLKLFENSGKFGDFALRRYKKLVEQYAKGLDPKSDKYWHTLKQIVDQITLAEENSLQPDVAKILNKLRDKYVPSIDKSIQDAKNPPKKVNEKPIKLKGTGGLFFKPEVYKSGGAKKSAAKGTSSPYFDVDNANSNANRANTNELQSNQANATADILSDWSQDIHAWDRETEKILQSKTDPSFVDEAIKKGAAETDQSLNKTFVDKGNEKSFDFM